MNFFIKRLNEPFPDSTTFREQFVQHTGVGLFIAMFLFYFRPFGLSGAGGWSLFWICMGFGGITLLVATIYHFILIEVIKVKTDMPTWTLKKWLLSVMCLITLIALANTILISYLSNINIYTPRILFEIIVNTWLVALFPVIFSGMITQMRMYRKNSAEADQIDISLSSPTILEETITIYAQNQKNEWTISPTSILYAQTMDNYVAIYFLEEQTIQKKVIRSSLSKIEEQLKGTSIIRCHRSYLVNTDHIEKVEGNAQGLRLTIQHLKDEFVPVSRKFIPVLKKE